MALYALVSGNGSHFFPHLGTPCTSEPVVCPDSARRSYSTDVVRLTRLPHEGGRLHRLLHDIDRAVHQTRDALRNGCGRNIRGHSHLPGGDALANFIAAEVAHVCWDDGEHDGPKATVKGGDTFRPEHLHAE